MSKKKKHLKTKQKKALKRRRRANTKKKQANRLKVKGPKIKVTPEMFPDKQWVFWLAHGVNYILSDYSTGTWKPLFDEIYEDKDLEPEALAKRLLGKFGEEKENWTPDAKAAVAWTIQDRSVVYVYYKAALRKLLVADPECDAKALARQPHQSTVWELFNFLKDKLLQPEEGEESDVDDETTSVGAGIQQEEGGEAVDGQ